MTTDPLAEAAQLAETLRAAIADLDHHIEQRAQQLTTPPTISQLINQAIDLLQQAGTAWREQMSQQMPQAREFHESLPTSVWTAAAARLALDICNERAKRDG